MQVSFLECTELPAYEGAVDFFSTLLRTNGCKRIFEVGSGANPTLTAEYVRDAGLTYVTSDLYPEELDKADAAFEKRVIDLSKKLGDVDLLESFDCVMSRMVGEHIQDGEQFHRNIYQMLRPGGISVHLLASLWTLPFALNRFLPEWLSDLALRMIHPRDEHRHGKFKAYYSWSRGPSPKTIKRFQDLGYEVVLYNGYFGHHYYKRRLPWLHKMEMLKMRWLVRHPVPQLTSYVAIILRKPLEHSASPTSQ